MLTVMGVRGVTACSLVSWKYYFTVIFPLALAKFMSSAMSHVSISKVPVSYAHTVKATMPLFTVAISRVLFSEKHSWSVYLSLVPIVAGVAVATVTEVSFDVLGLGSALGATAGFSLMNIFSKKALKDTGMHHLRLLCTLGRISCLMFLPIWLIFDFGNVTNHLSDENNVSSSIIFLLVIDGITHWLQNILAFTILKLVAPLTYAVANVTKRISIVTVSIILIGNQVTASNVCGMLMAILGVFYYNKVKYEENKARSTLPTTMTPSSGGVEKKGGSILWQNQRGVAEDAQHVKLITSRAPSQHASQHHQQNGSGPSTSNGFMSYSNYQEQFVGGYHASNHMANGFNGQHQGSHHSQHNQFYHNSPYRGNKNQ